MKKITAIAFISLFFAACNSEGNSNTNSATDTSSTLAPDNTITNDTAARSGDTSSYERMPQKQSDTTRR